MIVTTTSPALPSIFSSSPTSSSNLPGVALHCATRSVLTYLPALGKLCIGTSPRIDSIDCTRMRLWRAQAKRNSTRASCNMPLLLSISYPCALYGSVEGSIRLSASVMQTSIVNGKNINVEYGSRSNGSLFVKNERYIMMEEFDSVRLIEFASTSKAAVTSSVTRFGILFFCVVRIWSQFHPQGLTYIISGTKKCIQSRIIT